MSATPKKRERLDGLDIARYLAFVGMVIVNFKIAMGAYTETSLIAQAMDLLQGRAAALFVILAGIGLGLANGRSVNYGQLLKRAAFLMVLGLGNMLIFEADILHYYAVYFACAALLLPLSSRGLIVSALVINALFVAFIFSSDTLGFSYDTGWDWQTYEYQGLWTLSGFTRNLLVNGWHPLLPWLSFLIVGILVSRLPLAARGTQQRLVGYGVLIWLGAELLAMALSAADPELAEIATTGAIPPMPLYILAGIGCSFTVTGLCLWGQGAMTRLGITAAIAPAGRQSLTLYLAHILIGMGMLELLGLLSGQTASQALLAALIFCAIATVAAYFWAKHHKRGPLEWLMRTLAGALPFTVVPALFSSALSDCFFV